MERILCVSGYCPLSNPISLIADAWTSMQLVRKGTVGRNSEPWWLRQWNAVLINCFLSQILPWSSCVMMRSHKQPVSQKDAIFILSLSKYYVCASLLYQALTSASYSPWKPYCENEVPREVNIQQNYVLGPSNQIHIFPCHCQFGFNGST